MVGFHSTDCYHLVAFVYQLYHDSSTVSIPADIHKERGIVVERLHLDALLEGLACQAIDVHNGCTIHLKAIF